MSQWKKLGEILVETGVLSQKTVDRMLVTAKQQGKRFGVALEHMGLVTGEELADALAQQHNLKTIHNLTTYSYPQELLHLIPQDVAMQNLIFPLKRENDRLALAMADPTEMKVVKNLAANLDLKILPFVATRNDIHAAVCKFYLGKTPAESNHRSILLVEDEKFIQNIIAGILEKQGYHLVVAKDGLEGFKEAIAGKPHVIITDKVMPKLDGHALFRSLQAVPDTSMIPVILVSGTLSAQEEAESLDKGFFDCLPKPINEATLLSRVKRAFRFYDQKYSLC